MTLVSTYKSVLPTKSDIPKPSVKEEIVFKVGQIYLMAVGPRSHVKSPYYVEIIEVGKDYIVTNIPGEHALEIEKNNNWDYHIPRMEYVGTKSTHGHLLLDQKGLEGIGEYSTKIKNT